MVWVAGHFGEWLQGISRAQGALALVTLACPVRGVAVRCDPAPDLCVSDPVLVLGLTRARAMLQQLDCRTPLRIAITQDLPPGGGAGMSTAALVALARAVGAPEDLIAPACLQVEGATDPLMLPAPDATLWAPRAARSLAPLPPPPRAEIVGGLWGPPMPTDPGDTDFPEIDDLIADWARGPDLAGAARLAQTSADRTTELRGPVGDLTPALAWDLGALGWARAHTGPARALIFAPGAAPAGAEAALMRAGFAHVLRFETGGRG
ncbi:MAG: propanediol utilization protein [Alphaproteobacteria bacterium]|nr:propanediol utilization protein [Alphaproteobacteria bacterium]